MLFCLVHFLVHYEYMGLDKIETFEHDIASEILKKEASISKVAAADDLVTEVKNEITPPPKDGMSSSAMLVVIILVVIILAGGGGYFGYHYYLEHKPAPATAQTTKKPNGGSATSFASVFPELNTDIGGYVSAMEKNPYGYVVTFTDYTTVFSYTVKHENVLAQSIARALPTGNLIGDSFSFTDVTVSNVNMRIGESGSSTVGYAFVGTNKLIISTSTQGLSSIAGILK